MASLEVRPLLIASLSGIIRFGKHTIESSLVIGADEKKSENTAALGSMTAYQSILSLASEMEQPQLVYTLIFLTTQNSIWTSRKSGSLEYSLSNFSEIPSTTLPKIYRMRFDPNPKIAFAMRNLWRKVNREIPFADLIVELIKCTKDKSWNIRESSCCGLLELIPSCTLHEVLPFLTQLWESIFRASDDIKESVRTVAEKSLFALSKQILVWCEIKPAQIGGMMIPYFVLSNPFNYLNEYRLNPRLTRNF